jgi:hypothetical protein
VDLEQESRSVGGAAFDVDRCDRAALEHALMSTWSGAVIGIVSPVSTTLIRWR